MCVQLIAHYAMYPKCTYSSPLARSESALVLEEEDVVVVAPLSTKSVNDDHRRHSVICPSNRVPPQGYYDCVWSRCHFPSLFTNTLALECTFGHQYQDLLGGDTR